MPRRLFPLALASVVATGAPLAAEPEPVAPPPTEIRETIQVTATRVPEDVLDLPGSVTVVSAAELSARGVRDLAGALALVAGVSIAPGGDGGPASSVPELMGLREFDAFLLVVDGVPWGGAFNPALASLDLTGVERIEILRGSAPVLYGATSFVGVIHVLHYAAGSGERAAELGGGSYDTLLGSVIVPLPGASWRQSIVANGESRGFRDDRAGVERAHFLYRGAGAVAGGQLRLDLDAQSVDQDPYSPHPRQGRQLSTLVPLDANHNPNDARIDETRLHFAAGYDHRLGAGDWSTTLSFTSSERDVLRGFLMEDFEANDLNAAGYDQTIDQTDYFLDTHWAVRANERVSVVVGLDALGGQGEMKSRNFDYLVALDGSNPPSSSIWPTEERPELEDERLFAGLYAQVIWRPAERWRMELGARLNRTDEKREGEVETEEGEERATDEKKETRGGGSVGASFRAFASAGNEVWLFADYRDTYKPAAIDFGPEAEGGILDPETATAWEGGIKGQHLDGRLSWQASAFQMDFENLVVSTVVDGRPAIENAGEERFEGYELEGTFRVSDALALQASYAHHEARFRDYVRAFDGVPTQLRGKRLEMSPEELAAFGIRFAPEHGPIAHAEIHYVGDRYLDKRNRSLADAYTTCSAGFGWRFERFEVRLDGWNLSDERDPVAESELGDAQYYRLPARSWLASGRWRF